MSYIMCGTTGLGMITLYDIFVIHPIHQKMEPINWFS